MQLVDHLHNPSLANGPIQATKHPSLHYASLGMLLYSLPITNLFWYALKLMHGLCVPVRFWLSVAEQATTNLASATAPGRAAALPLASPCHAHPFRKNRPSPRHAHPFRKNRPSVYFEIG